MIRKTLAVLVLSATITGAALAQDSGYGPIRHSFCQAVTEESTLLTMRVWNRLDAGTADSRLDHLMKRARLRVATHYGLNEVDAGLLLMSMLKANPDIGRANSLLELTTSCGEDAGE